MIPNMVGLAPTANMSYQKILLITTATNSLRAEAISHELEDGHCAFQAMYPIYNEGNYAVSVKKIRKGNSNLGVPNYPYPTPLHAMGDKWKLMAPPVEKWDYRQDLITEYIWWFSRED